MHRAAKNGRLLASQRVPLPPEFLTVHHLYELRLMPCSHEVVATNGTIPFELFHVYPWFLMFESRRCLQLNVSTVLQGNNGFGI